MAEDKKPDIPSLLNNVDLAPYNTLSVSSETPLFTEVKKEEELFALYQNDFFIKHNFFILGGGSNVLFRNSNTGPILKMSIPGISAIARKKNEVFIRSGAGIEWHRLVQWCVGHKFAGIENLALIPGTTGAAPIQNIGAYGVELSDVFEELTWFDIKNGNIKTFSKAECNFDYRDSIFKNELKGLGVVTSVTLRLKTSGFDLNTSYKTLHEYLKKHQIKNPEIRDLFHAVVDVRRSRLPDPSKIGNAGSFFKNPIVQSSKADELQKIYPEIPVYPVSKGLIKIAAGWLIEKAGWKGKRIGNVGTYDKQALVIVNYGGADGKEIWEFSKKIQREVQNKFGIDLVPEVNIVDNS